MLRNYLKIAMRSLWRSKVHSFINIIGLSLGIACCVLIILFVKDELTFDTFHKKADRIYRAFVKEDYGENEQFFNTVTPFPLGPTLQENLPEIEHLSPKLKPNFLQSLKALLEKKTTTIVSTRLGFNPSPVFISIRVFLWV